MKRRAVAIALIFASAACSSANREVAVRPINADTAAPGKDALARGQLLFSRGEPALALDAYRRAMRQDPADANALNGVAISYAAMGRHDLARDYFELALARAPLDERIHRNFARSMMAQGLQAEASALLAEIGQGVTPGKARRPTLAQLAAEGGKPAAFPVRAAGLELERVSMGEVRLRTLAAGTARPALPGRITAQLTTAIVTVADAVGKSPVPAIALSRELTATIVKLPAPAEKLAGSGCNGKKDAAATGAGLLATGYSIKLLPTGHEAGSAQACATMAGGDEPDKLFQKLWAWSGGRG